MKDQNIYDLDYSDMIREMMIDEIASLEEIKEKLEIKN